MSKSHTELKINNICIKKFLFYAWIEYINPLFLECEGVVITPSGPLERGWQGGGGDRPPVFRDFHLFSQKSAQKMLKIGLFCVFRPPSFCIAPSVFKKLQRPCSKRFKFRSFGRGIFQLLTGQKYWKYIFLSFD